MSGTWKPLGLGTGQRPEGVRDDDIVRFRPSESAGIRWQLRMASELRWSTNCEYELLVPTPTAESDDVTMLRARVALLHKALQDLTPANIGSSNPNIPDDYVLPCDITMGELRRARAALASTTEGEAGNG